MKEIEDTPTVKDAIRVVLSQFRIRMFYLAVTVSGSSFGKSAQISGADMIFSKQNHRRWRYYCRLLDYQSPFFQLIFPFDHQIPGIIKYLQSSNSFGSLKSILSFEMTLTPSDHERQFQFENTIRSKIIRHE